MTLNLYIYTIFFSETSQLQQTKILDHDIFPQKKKQVEVENMTKNRTKVYMYISGHLGIFATSVTFLTSGTCGENLLKPKWPERKDLFPEFWGLC